MPRPGPRPYECVKRAWHSDRHQPIRGSIICQIIRLATEAHSEGTKKNKEWQEKLPVVILKAEEIIYSKANSEEEYTDVDTMWNRVCDAIDTIIRRDESTESDGNPLLPPCVEAALNLGCIAVKASRSQRHCNITTYLPPTIQQPLSASPSYHHQAAVPVDFLDDCNNRVAPPPCGYPFLHESVQVNQKPLSRKLGTSSAPVNLGSVYPLYYGGNNQTQQLERVPVIIGMPIGIKAPEEETESLCDLSLRLGISSEQE